MTLKEEAHKYDLKDFEVLKELGEGQFGTVYLVTNKDKKKFYALKCISKYETLKCKLENHLKVLHFLHSERKVSARNSSIPLHDGIHSLIQGQQLHLLPDRVHQWHGTF
jgi:serine/threonine protein kinase